jgi:hypothetical protein
LKNVKQSPIELATAKQIKAAKLMVENGGTDSPKSKGEILREAGYSEAIANNPSKVIEADGFKSLMEEFLPDDETLQTHKKVLRATKVEHMVFPLAMEDEEIIDLLEDAGCTVKKFKHGETATHVWFWADDNSVRLKAVELAYKVKGRLSGDGGKPVGGGNMFINNAHFNADKYLVQD